MKYAIIDVETTGLDKDLHEIIEIGCVLTDGEKVEEFEAKVWPLNISAADPKALLVNGYKEEDWKEEAFLLPNALLLLNAFVGKDRPYFMSYNVTFDWGFIEKAYKRTNIPNPFHYHRLDIMTMAWLHYEQKSLGYGSISLKTLCNLLDIPPEPAVHRALGGARCAYQVMNKLTNI